MRGFVFDLDNTLFDRYATITRILTDDYEKLKPYLNAAYDPDRAIDHVIHTEALNIMNGWEGVYDRLKAEYFFNMSNTPSYIQFHDYLMYKFSNIAVPFAFTQKLLEDIKKSGRKLGIITNGSSKLQKRKIELLGFKDLFDCIIISGEFSKNMSGSENDIRYWKPNREIFDQMSKCLDIAACDLYYVGDNPQNDVIGSAKAGYVPVWIMAKSPWPYDNSLLPEHRFYNIEGVRALL